MKVKVLATQLCDTLCHPMDCSLPGSSVHGIFQARILEWVGISYSRESSSVDSLPTAPPGKPYMYIYTIYIYWSSSMLLASQQPKPLEFPKRQAQ